MFKFLAVLVFFRDAFAQKPLLVNIPKQGVIRGKEITKFRTERIYGFLGIPYAQPPLSDLKFAPPQIDPLPSWDDVRNATEYPPSCLQVRKTKDEDLPFFKIITDGNFETDEDCLYLNVFVPSGKPPSRGFASIVWIHPGNFESGSPNVWNPFRLVSRHKVIVVTIAYRLNVMGFFTSMDGEAPGNFGLMDQQAALGWVKENVKLFGGDSERICLMGYGAGATSVGLHLINQNSKGLFSGAIAMGGGLFRSDAVRDPKRDEETPDRVGYNHGCIRKPTSLLMECLRLVDSKLIVEENRHYDWKPIYDRGLSNNTPPFVPGNVKGLFERGEFHKVPLLTGYTNMEGASAVKDFPLEDMPANATEEFLSALLADMVSRDLAISNDTDGCSYNANHLADAVTFFYGPATPIGDRDDIRRTLIDFATDKNVASSTFLLASYASKYRPTYAYRFDLKPNTQAVLSDLPDWVSVPHLFDLLYVWGAPYWIQLPGGWDGRDRQTADLTMLFWTNFAKYANPTESSSYAIRWDPFTTENPGMLLMDGTYVMSTAERVNYKSFRFWNEYYPKVLDVATTCCNVTDGGRSLTRRHFDAFAPLTGILAFTFLLA